jgi:hypothetical protein
VKSLFPALKNPANRHKAVGFSAEEFHYAFTNTLTEEESRKVWERYAIAAPGSWVWEFGLFANFKPGHQDTWVDYDADRAPLLFTTRSRRPSPSSTSSRTATTGRAPHPAGRPSPTMPSTGRCAMRHRCHGRRPGPEREG